MIKTIYYFVIIIILCSCSHRLSEIRYGIVDKGNSKLLYKNREVESIYYNERKYGTIGQWEENDSLIKCYSLSTLDSLDRVKMINSVSDTTSRTVICIRRNNYDSPLFFIHTLDQNRSKISERASDFDSIGVIVVNFKKDECRFLVIKSLYNPPDTFQVQLKDSLYIDLKYKRDIIRTDYFLMKKNQYYMIKKYGVKWYVPLNAKCKTMKKFDYKLLYIDDDL